ncbi:MAG: UbiH/UbiF/VisC/COQ6 family ubiquinone biosynthesis hydroxylase [Acidiferrobacterales bacterium]
MQTTRGETGVTHDVIIVGGGIVGATLACALADARLRIALLERYPPPSSPTGDYDIRVSSISPGSRLILEAVGAWSGLQQSRICAVEQMHVWDAGGPAAIHFDSADIGEPCLAYIIENSAMLAALWSCARRVNVELHCPTDVDAVDFCDANSAVLLRDGRQLVARLVVGADGPQSTVRTDAGIGTTAWDYAQHGIVATVETERPHSNIAWQRFLPSGPLAFLPLADGRSSIVWSVDTPYAEELLLLDDADFRQELESAFGANLGAIRSTGPRSAFPLQRTHAARYVSARAALVGDAAHTVHPLAGQGANLGLFDAAVLAEVLLDAHRRNRDIGSLTVLRRYERWRKGDNLAMLFLTDALKRLFGNSITLVERVRNIGLDLTNAAAPIKHMLMRRAAGLEGDLPMLARPKQGLQSEH